ncbi:hypothetical protein B0H14DRAFT_508208 [Mycena olivaceomarginata]|nr:hypothetical protein B0H14DRAFT_508208 [Mycena olivaceomarginata]
MAYYFGDLFAGVLYYSEEPLVYTMALARNGARPVIAPDLATHLFGTQGQNEIDPGWIEASLRCGELQSSDQFPSQKKFSGLSMVIEGFTSSDTAHLTKIIEDNGGVVDSRVRLCTSILVVGASEGPVEIFYKQIQPEHGFTRSARNGFCTV